MKKHANLSIFVPHQGCKCRCSFCNQNQISGEQKPPTPTEVAKMCSKFLPQSGQGKDTEIAFFGGSFTAIEPEYMLSLLKAAYPFVLANRANGIRISTRPDAIDTTVLQTLKGYGVTAIELGAQSMLDTVLEKNRRGHTADDVCKSAQLIKENGFLLGLQMMTGLYGEDDTTQAAMYTMEEFLKLLPDTVRIYPALVLQGTLLAQLYEKGEYTPQTLDLATTLVAKLIQNFAQNNIKVIRVGLHADVSLEQGFLAGPYHPAFRQLCETKIYSEKILNLLHNKKNGEYILQIPKGQRSTVAGQKNIALADIQAKGYNVILQENETLPLFAVELLG